MDKLVFEDATSKVVARSESWGTSFWRFIKSKGSDGWSREEQIGASVGLGMDEAIAMRNGDAVQL